MWIGKYGISTSVTEYRRLAWKHGRIGSMRQKGRVCANEKMSNV